KSHRGGLLVLPPASQPAARPAGGSERNTIQPAREQVWIADRPSLACQNQEDGLEGILGIVHVTQDLPADVQNHRPVPAHKRSKCRLCRGIAPAAEPLD